MKKDIVLHQSKLSSGIGAAYYWASPRTASGSPQRQLHIRHDIELSASHFGYLGIHGCHLSLFSWSETGVAGGLELDLSERADMASWETSSARYLLVSRRMNDSRFAMIAGALRQITDAHGQPDTETAELLGGAHQSCVSTG